MDNTSHDHFLSHDRRNTILALESTQTIEQAKKPKVEVITSQRVPGFSREKLRHRDGFGRLKKTLVVRQGEYYLRPKDGRLDILTVQRSNQLSTPTPWIKQIIRCIPAISLLSRSGSIWKITIYTKVA